VYTVVLAGKSPNIRSYTVYIHGSGQPYVCAVFKRCCCMLPRAWDETAGEGLCRSHTKPQNLWVHMHDGAVLQAAAAVWVLSCMRTCSHSTHTQTHTLSHAHTHALSRTHTHTHTHTQTHTHTLVHTQNTQPASLTWNVMGMMNNCYFRVLLHPFMDDKGALGVRFQHPAPVEIGERGDVGWREEDNMRMQVCVSMCVCICVCVCPCVCVFVHLCVFLAHRSSGNWRAGRHMGSKRGKTRGCACVCVSLCVCLFSASRIGVQGNQCVCVCSAAKTHRPYKQLASTRWRGLCPQ